jgi:hypothetical protein
MAPRRGNSLKAANQAAAATPEPVAAATIRRPLFDHEPDKATDSSVLGKRPAPDEAADSSVLGKRPAPDEATDSSVLGKRPAPDEAADSSVLGKRPAPDEAAEPQAALLPRPKARFTRHRQWFQHILAEEMRSLPGHTPKAERLLKAFFVMRMYGCDDVVLGPSTALAAASHLWHDFILNDTWYYINVFCIEAGLYTSEGALHHTSAVPSDAADALFAAEYERIFGPEAADSDDDLLSLCK